ncbi:hypothetical protein KL935_001466 [Ogataea polymorpha]|nr:hypothetical protein KL935_001466 [Ogataea polymorpha]
MDNTAPRKSPVRKPPPPHLSEFYSFVNGSSAESQPQLETSTLQSGSKDPFQEDSLYDIAGLSLGEVQRKLRADSSRTESLLSLQPSMTPSTLDLETLITKKDVNDTIASCRDLARTAAAYREALNAVSIAASEFGRSLEDCARCKGAGSASEGLMTASGFHHQIANHQQILAHSLSDGFEKPILNIISDFERSYKANDATFKKEIREKVLQLRQKEATNNKLSRKKTRNIIAYKSNLLQLASQLDEIDRAKHDYYVSSYDQTQATFTSILAKTSSVIAMETQMYESIANKAHSGGGLDKLLAQEPSPTPEIDTNSETRTLEASRPSSVTAQSIRSDNSHHSEPADSHDEADEADEANRTTDSFFSPPVVTSRDEASADAPEQQQQPDHTSTFSLPTATSPAVPLAPTVTHTDSVSVQYM